MGCPALPLGHPIKLNFSISQDRLHLLDGEMGIKFHLVEMSEEPCGVEIRIERVGTTTNKQTLLSELHRISGGRKLDGHRSEIYMVKEIISASEKPSRSRSP